MKMLENVMEEEGFGICGRMDTGIRLGVIPSCMVMSNDQDILVVCSDRGK